MTLILVKAFTAPPPADGASALTDEEKALQEQHALETFGKPEDVVGLVAFLVSEEARFITGKYYSYHCSLDRFTRRLGQTISVNGGTLFD